MARKVAKSWRGRWQNHDAEGDKIMDMKNIGVYCDPLSKLPLDFKKAQQVNELSAYPIINGIPDFLDQREVLGLNQKYMRFYDKISFLYRWSARFSKNGIEELLGDMAVKNGDRILEVSVGTGDNLRYLHEKAPKADYWGLDISARMLHQCQKNLKRWGISAELAHGNAEQLPYADEQFDVVFHIGGINFFDDKQAAILELIRVSKAGTKIIIVDETDKWVKNVYQKTPFVSNYYKGMDDTKLTNAPIEYIPKDMLDIRLEYKWNGGMYKLSFLKP